MPCSSLTQISPVVETERQNMNTYDRIDAVCRKHGWACTEIKRDRDPVADAKAIAAIKRWNKARPPGKRRKRVR